MKAFLLFRVALFIGLSYVESLQAAPTTAPLPVKAKDNPVNSQPQAVIPLINSQPQTEKQVTKLHSAPVILTATDLDPELARELLVRKGKVYPLTTCGLFQTSEDGSAIPIPFQIDEKDDYGDYILDQGKNANSAYSNGVFDNFDEISFMGNDIGPKKIPTEWIGKKPSILYELIFKRGDKEGAVYFAVFGGRPPVSSNLNYVRFNLKNAEVETSRYRYQFDENNYLVVRGISVKDQKGSEKRLIDSSTFYLKADFQYFVTVSANHQRIQSELDAYKTGPVRTIARVNFNLVLLGMQFQLGMYTEVSFFSNAVVLPAILDNPINGEKSLNKNSLFYYGLATVDNPEKLKISSNMPAFKEEDRSFFNMSSILGKKKSDELYWVSALAPGYMLHFEFKPSADMIKMQSIPRFYVENTAADQMEKRSKGAQPLGKSPVNMALGFDLHLLKEGVHLIKFQLFFENFEDPETLDQFRNLSEWRLRSKKIGPREF
ncbi:MAG: hypothetical protein KA436_00945 [Oligoflexales bacterium]|nr:hypothetical protein [Oligoflexales bacterium]